MSAPAHVLQHSKSAAEASAKGPQKPPVLVTGVLLTPAEAAQILKVSLSWLAKARMRGDGPPFIKIGRAIRYSEAALQQWVKSQQRLSTSER
jgi:predicted DNA-binding transcriptional regulator AlpA